MNYTVDNAIIMAAGSSSRFAPLSYEKHKAFTVVKNEILIERQIKQLIETGIKEIYVITGYKSEDFQYLAEKYGVNLIKNNDYLTKNNISSLYVAKKYIKNTYICSSDNYFADNPFNLQEKESFYSAVYAKGKTNEWCLTTDKEEYITSVNIGGEKSWYMLGHAFFDENFSKKFIPLIENAYFDETYKNLLWEKLYINNIKNLKLKIKKYPENFIFEFDTLEDLKTFDTSYINDTRSTILKDIAKQLNLKEKDITVLNVIKDNTTEAIGFEFTTKQKKYIYKYFGGLQLIK